MRLSFENWLKSLKSVISLISLKSVHFSHFGLFLRFHSKSVHLTLNGTAFSWKNWYFSSKVSLLISSKKSLENRQFSVKKMQTV